MTFVSCYLCRGREKAYLPGLVVCASSASEGSTSGRQERSSKVYFLYLCVFVFFCVFVYLRNCVFDVMFAALVPVMAEQLAGRRRKGGKVCWGKRRPAIISPCLAATGLINERRVKLSAPGSCCSGTM